MSSRINLHWKREQWMERISLEKAERDRRQTTTSGLNANRWEILKPRVISHGGKRRGRSSSIPENKNTEDSPKNKAYNRMKSSDEIYLPERHTARGPLQSDKHCKSKEKAVWVNQAAKRYTSTNCAIKKSISLMAYR